MQRLLPFRPWRRIDAEGHEADDGCRRRGPLVAIDEVFYYFKNHPQNLDHGPLDRTLPLAGVVRGESIGAGVEAAL